MFFFCNSAQYHRQQGRFFLRIVLSLSGSYLMYSNQHINLYTCVSPLELQDKSVLLINSFFLLRSIRESETFLPTIVNVPPNCTKHFACSFLIRTRKEWILEPASLFPADTTQDYSRLVNRYVLDRCVASSVTSVWLSKTNNTRDLFKIIC